MIGLDAGRVGISGGNRSSQGLAFWCVSNTSGCVENIDVKRNVMIFFSGNDHVLTLKEGCRERRGGAEGGRCKGAKQRRAKVPLQYAECVPHKAKKSVTETFLDSCSDYSHVTMKNK